ncbi:MAG: hypothetical protein ABIO63_06190 [Casimicrobiaceae bacterium]
MIDTNETAASKRQQISAYVALEVFDPAAPKHRKCNGQQRDEHAPSPESLESFKVFSEGL